MQDLLNAIPPVEKAEYNQLAERYYSEVLRAPELLKLKYFAEIQKQVERKIRQKFNILGYKLVREESAPGMFYKIVSKKDAFGFNVIDRHIILSGMILDACFAPPVVIPGKAVGIEFFPDVRMLTPEYRKEKIEKIADRAIKSFIPMKKLI